MQAQACLACPEGGPFLGTAFHALQIQLSINSCPAGGVVREHQTALCMSCAALQPARVPLMQLLACLV